MPDILQRIGVKAAITDVYRALTTPEGLSNWWATDTRGDATVDGVLQFRFAEKGGFDMRIIELEPNAHVLWKVVDGPEEWLGTTLRWDLEQDGEWVILLFAHEGWRAPVEFMHHCSTKWAIFLMSLKALVETGAGAPFPRDIKIDNWN